MSNSTFGKGANRAQDFADFEKLPAKCRELLRFHSPENMNCRSILDYCGKRGYDDEEMYVWLKQYRENLTTAIVHKTYGRSHPQAKITIDD